MNKKEIYIKILDVINYLIILLILIVIPILTILDWVGYVSISEFLKLVGMLVIYLEFGLLVMIAFG